MNAGSDIIGRFDTYAGGDLDEDGSSYDIVRVSIGELRDSDSPRLGGVDPDHVHTLAALEGPLPPILVHEGTMSVIDGMHRLSAAKLNGRLEIEVRFFRGSIADAFRLGVRANVTHGLPLSKADRQAAAVRIIRSHPQLSDRGVAAVAGLAPGTIASLRGGVAEAADIRARIGRDGRVRPLSTAEGRLIAGRVIASRPETPLREVARQAGISLGTARDVRTRVLAGESPIPRQRHRSLHASVDTRDQSVDERRLDRVDVTAAIEGLRRDPSLRYTDSGRTFLRWLGSRVVTATEWREVGDGLPPHCTEAMAKVALECARVWMTLAEELDPLSDRACS